MCTHPDSWTRRQLLASAALAGGYKPQLAVAFYVWTQMFQRQKKTLADGVEEACAATRRAGYRRVELMSQFFRPEVREKTVRALKLYKLEMPSVYNGGSMHTAAEAEQSIADTLQVAAAARTVKARLLNFNPSPKPKRERKSEAELDAQARHVNELGQKLRDQGLKLQLHHHNPEMEENAREWRHLLNNTDPKLVWFCVDVDWVRRGGQQPLALLREAAPRLASLHLRNSRQDVWTEDFGDGDIDYGAVAGLLKEIGFQGLLVVELAYQKETQLTRSLEEDLKLSRVFTEKTFGLR